MKYLLLDAEQPLIFNVYIFRPDVNRRTAKTLSETESLIALGNDNTGDLKDSRSISRGNTRNIL
jgi:hypothetical protein